MVFPGRVASVEVGDTGKVNATMLTKVELVEWRADVLTVAGAAGRMATVCAEDHDFDLPAPVKTVGAARSLRHFWRLCRAYEACMASLRSECTALLEVKGPDAEVERRRLVASIEGRVAFLALWDRVVERSGYAGTMEPYRLLACGLGLECRRRLRRYCTQAACDPDMDRRVMLGGLRVPDWFAEIRRAEALRRQQQLAAAAFLALVGAFLYGWLT